jgi:hypothetical protein
MNRENVIGSGSPTLTNVVFQARTILRRVFPACESSALDAGLQTTPLKANRAGSSLMRLVMRYRDRAGQLRVRSSASLKTPLGSDEP